MLPSARLAGLPGQDSKCKTRRVRGLYEPIHGTAPDIAGQDLANPLATILSVAMMMRYTFDLPEVAARIEAAVEAVLDQGLRTRDILPEGSTGLEQVGTAAMTQAVIDAYGD